MKKQILKISSIIFLTLLLTACGGKDSDDTNKVENTNNTNT
jgi:predicted small secreted protein